MKATIFSMFVVLGLMITVPMLVMNDEELMGDLFGSGGSGGEQSIASLKAKAPKNVTTVSVKQDVKMYKWVDDNGVPQFSQTPPAGIVAQEMNLKPQLNTMQAPHMPAPEAEPAPVTSMPVANPYNPSAMKQVMKQTKQLQQQLNSQMADRKAKMDGMMK